jgi:hypothetical protein
LLGQSTFELEKLSEEPGVDEVTIGLPAFDASGIQLKSLAAEVRRLFNLVLVRDFDLEVIEGEEEEVEDTSLPAASALCLFSGGVDSVCGFKKVAGEADAVRGLFCSHVDQSKIRRIVASLDSLLIKPMGGDLLTLRVPPMGKSGFRQTRGFMYILVGMAVAQACAAGRFVVSEVGPTMYQPRFAPLDDVTMTTHPYVVAIARQVARTVLGRSVSLELPFEDSTKAEIMARYDVGGLFGYTHSCISQRFGRHDGTCYGCVMRRLSAVAAGVEDVEYMRDPVLDSSAASDNLSALLAFCIDILSSFDELPDHQRENIDLFDKRDLFERYSLDILAGLHSVALSYGRLSEGAASAYLVAKSKLGVSILEERLETLRAMKAQIKP